MLNRLRPVLIGAVWLAAPWLAANAAMAETSQPSTTVSAGVDRQAYDFVQSYAASTVKLDQIARWHDALCVEVTGLPTAQAAQVKGRVEEVAKAVGVGTAQAGCKSNVQVMFTAQPQHVLDTIADSRKSLLGYDHRDAKTLKTMTLPIQSWYVTATVGAAGPNAGAIFSPNTASGTGGLSMQTGSGVIDGPDIVSPTGCGDNHFTACLQSEFQNAMVVVDMGHVGKASVGLIADYAAMLALSQPRALGTCNALPSVTDVFASGCAGRTPDELTPADAAYLTALYSADLEKAKAGEQADIAGRMARMLSADKVATR